MPLFFIITGLTMNNQKLSIMNIKELVRNKSTIGRKEFLVMWCFLIPYLFFLQQMEIAMSDKYIICACGIVLYIVSLGIVKCVEKCLPIMFLKICDTE